VTTQSTTAWDKDPTRPTVSPESNALVAEAFVGAVNQYFGKDHLITDIARSVAHARTQYLEDLNLLDPLGTERLHRTTLGDEKAATKLDDEIKARGQVLALPVLINEGSIRAPSSMLC